MSILGDTQRTPGQLRRDAEVCLSRGNFPVSHDRVLGKDALSTLYRLASTPESAADGLRLLHELQTHQVELDMQYEEFQSAELEYSSELGILRSFFDMSPVGHFMISGNGLVLECNSAGAAMMVQSRGELLEQRLDMFFAPESRGVFGWQLEKLLHGHTSIDCKVRLKPALAGSTAGSDMRLVARLAPDGATVLVTISDAPRT